MKSLSKVIVISSIGVFVSLLIIVFLIKPILGEIIGINKDVTDKKLESDTLDQQITAFKTAKVDLAKATRKQEIIDSIVPKESLVVAVKDMELAAAKTGTTTSLSIKEIDQKNKLPEVISGKQASSEVQFELTSFNDYIGTINFLSLLEHSPRFVELYKIVLTPETLQGTAGQEAVRTGRVLGTFDGIFVIKNK